MAVKRVFRESVKLFAFMLIFLIATGIGAGGVLGQGEGFSLSPLSFEAVLQPGESATGQMVVRNVGGEALALRIYVCDVIPAAGDVGAVRYITADELDASASVWYSVSPVQLALAPGEEARVDVFVSVPGDSIEGSYCGAVFAETIPNDRGAARVGNRIGMLTYLTVGEPSRIPAAITRMRLRNWWRRAPYVEITLENSGPVHQAMSGLIEIRQAGQLRGQLEVPRVILQPESTRTVAIAWDSPPRWGYFVMTGILHGDNGAFGPVEISCLLFPLASVSGMAMLILAIHLLREKGVDPFQRIKKPGR